MPVLKSIIVSSLFTLFRITRSAIHRNFADEGTEGPSQHLVRLARSFLAVDDDKHSLVVRFLNLRANTGPWVTLGPPTLITVSVGYVPAN